MIIKDRKQKTIKMIFVKHLKFAFIEALEKLISKLIKIFTVGKCFIYLLFM